MKNIKLYKIGTMWLWLLSPIIPAIFLYKNLLKVGKKEKAEKILISTVGMSLLIMLGKEFLSELGIIISLISFSIAIIFYLWFVSVYREHVLTYITKNKSRIVYYSGRRVVLEILGWLTIIFVLAYISTEVL